MRLAAEAMEVPVFIDREAWRLLAMKGTACDVQPSATFELGVAADQGNEADKAAQFV